MRESGYYWVRLKKGNKWVIAEYYKGSWLLNFDYPIEIDEKIIERA